MIMHADIYYAYEPIFKYVIEPFTDKPLDVLFNIARYLALHKHVNYTSRVIILYTLVKLSRLFGNFKTARLALEQLRLLRAPPQYQSQIDIATLEIRAKPYTDSDEFQPMCYGCGRQNPVLEGHHCVHCDAEFVYSFTTFEALPVIEFALEEGMSSSEAMELIRSEPEEPFNIDDIAMNKKRSGIPRLSRKDLINLKMSSVYVCQFGEEEGMANTRRYYLKVIPELNITKCCSCQKMFHSDDYMMAVLQSGRCPVCRFRVQLKSQGSYEETLDLL